MSLHSHYSVFYIGTAKSKAMMVIVSTSYLKGVKRVIANH